MKKIVSFIAATALATVVVCNAAFADGANYGDVDVNGSVNAADALAILQHATSLKILEENLLDIADVSGDGNVNAVDALNILQFSAGIINEFPVQENKAPSTTQEILDYYKKLAVVNSDVVTAQSFDLVSIDLGSFLLTSAIKPFASLVIDANTVDVNGFPGDAANLTVEDLQSATYVENEDGTVSVTLKIKGQTDSLVGEKHSGPVGKAIGVVGNIPQVIVNTGADKIVNVDDAEVELVYRDAQINVTVDADQKLVKGKCSWMYTVDGDVENVDITYSALAIDIKDASIVAEVDYKLEY